MIDRANHEFYKSHFKKIMTSKQIFKIKSKIRGTPYFLKDFISNDLENIKDSMIITVIEKGTPKNIYDHNYNDL